MKFNFCDECGEQLGSNYAWGGPCDFCARKLRECGTCGDTDCEEPHSSDAETSDDE